MLIEDTKIKKAIDETNQQVNRQKLLLQQKN